jgi:hypothetical protein
VEKIWEKREIFFHLFVEINKKICEKGNEIRLIKNWLIFCSLMSIEIGEATIATR